MMLARVCARARQASRTIVEVDERALEPQTGAGVGEVGPAAVALVRKSQDKR